jgi:hypothetical protein
MQEQEKSSERDVDGLDEGSQDLDKTAAPGQKKEDPAEPRFVDWPKD